VGARQGIVELTKTFRFEAAHHLPLLPPEHKCHRVHGHGYEIVVTVRGAVDPATGWFLDFGEISGAVKPLVRQLDHQLLNDLPGLANPTAEMLAIWLWDHLHGRLRGLHELEVRETDSASCRYRGETAAEEAVP
jgi:6-pyruvoyltetrahydropterin/6-carboxytetrahydropterin synthase